MTRDNRGLLKKAMAGLSLRTKLIIAFAIMAIIPLLCVNIITTQLVEESITGSIFEKNQNLADTLARELNADFDGKIRILKVAANNPDIRSMEPGRQTQMLQDILRQYPDMGMAAISAANGTQTGRSDGMPDSSITYVDREYFQQLMKTNDTSVSDVLKAKSSDRIVIVIAEPIRNDDGTIRGALLVNVELHKLVARIGETHIGKSGYAYVVNKEGKIIMHPDATMVSNATDYSHMAPVKAAVSGKTGWAQYESLGEKELAGYSYVPSTGWGLVVQQPLDEAMEDVSAVRNTNSIILACTVLLAFVIIIALVEALFKPIALLTAAAGKVSEGDLTVQASVVSSDEIGTLASTFNTMLLQIRAREEALQESRRQLADIINFLPDPTFVIDLEGKIIAWNRAIEETTGVKATDMQGKGNYEYSIPFYGERRPLLLDFIVGNEADPEKKYPFLQKKGDLFISETFSSVLCQGKGVYLHVTASPLYNTKGTIIGAIESLRDITLWKRAEEEILRKNEELNTAYEKMRVTTEELRHNYGELQRSQQALTQARKKLNLLNLVTFTDIQNAIFSLSGYMELEKLQPAEEKTLEYRQKQEKIIQTISASLKFAKNYQDLGIKAPAWQDVLQAFLIGISHIDSSKLSRKIQVDNLEVYADPLLEKVFLTLAENVLLHGTTATEISLMFKEDSEGLTLIFEDNGAGIPVLMKDKIFERRIKGKDGLGLFLAREILSITGITIKETGMEGNGARFEMLVPKGAYRFSGRIL
ncbi:MAG: cache domain-containing protein [Methanoregula sp.]|nr:cache domain-containing protein [Methanoregula sp.]